MQGMLQKANKMPTTAILDAFKSQITISHNLLECKRGIKKHLKDLIKLQKALFTISETKIDIEVPKGDEIFEAVDKNFERVLPFVNETVDRWNSRTMLAKNLGQKSKSFGKTILE